VRTLAHGNQHRVERKAPSHLIQEGRVQMIGCIHVYVTAARYFNLCRRKGIQGSNNDFILCACSALWKMPILSKDKDFAGYRKILPIELAQPRDI
jgi:hypothetical protein